MRYEIGKYLHESLLDLFLISRGPSGQFEFGIDGVLQAALKFFYFLPIKKR
jgi:hypothetical protein